MPGFRREKHFWLMNKELIKGFKQKRNSTGKVGSNPRNTRLK